MAQKTQMAATKLTGLIRGGIANLIKQPGFQEWVIKTALQQGDVILINNSFVYRNVSTIKSDLYLALQVDGDGKIIPEPVVTSGFSINSDFKHISAKAKNMPAMLSLSQAVGKELAELGTIMFILLGHITDNVQVSETINHDAFKAVVWSPTHHEKLTITNGTLTIKDAYDVDTIWAEVEARLAKRGEPVPAGLRSRLGEALEALQNKAMARLDLPSKGGSLDDGMTDQIVKVLRKHRSKYADDLQKCKGSAEVDGNAFNEVLRLAYNFASDAMNFLNLIVSICDLKPVVLWGTISEHYALAEAFGKLPWANTRKKPSLPGYLETIGEARNRAFHNLFPFSKTLSAELPKATLGNMRLQIFSEFARKKENRLEYKDKHLVDLLTEFTRAKERRVTPEFWKTNLGVMDATISLFQATSTHMKELWRANRP